MLGFRHTQLKAAGVDPLLVDQIYYSETSGETTTLQNFFISLSVIITFSTGLFLTVARLYEPLFRMLALQKIYEFWGEIYTPKEGSFEESQIANDALPLSCLLPSM